MKLNLNQRIAYKYYKAYAALCGQQDDGIEGRDQVQMRTIREINFMMYKKYDPDNSFDVSKEYDE